MEGGTEGYDPLFAYGYGLTYADEDELGELSEDAGERTTASRTVYFDGGPVAPWRLFLGDDAEPRVAVESAVVTTRGSENLVVRAVDREVQEDAREAVWSGAGTATVYLAAREPIDLSRESNGEMALSLDVRVDSAPTAAVMLGMTCGEGCAGARDVASLLSELPPGEWSTLAVRLRCFEDAGADMRRIERPFSLSTAGPLSVRFADVRLVSAAESEATCP